MKIGDARRNHKRKQRATMNATNREAGVFSIKSLIVGKQTTNAATVVADRVIATNTSPNSKRSTLVLVSEGPSVQCTSLEFTTLDPTEAPSFTSYSTTGADSFVLAIEDTDDHSSTSNNDPYLCQQQYRSSNRLRRQGVSPNSLSRCDETFVTAMNNNNKSQFQGPERQVFTFTTLSTSGGGRGLLGEYDDRRDCQDSKEEGRTELTHDTFSVSESTPAAEDKSCVQPSRPTAKLVSLGTFDFPAAAVQEVKSSSKSLGKGCFEIPEADSLKNDKDKNKPPGTPTTTEGLGFSSPFSAISKGLKALGSLALPRALHFELVARQEPPPTPVSQAGTTPEDELESPQMARLRLKAEQECDCWNAIVTQLITTHGKLHSKTAEGLMQLGHAYMLAREYAQAVIAFQSACRIWKQLQKTQDDQLALARVVDAIGMAWARVSQEDDRDHCHKAMTALEEAFQIRYDLLGPWHIDTVETLNKIASVHLHLREYSEACNAYLEVFWVRRAVFGSEHPSVAIAAHALGNVFVKLAATEEAAKFFQIAVDIYEKMNLSNKHPAVKRLMTDYKRLDRICLTRRDPQLRQGTRAL